MEPSAVQKCGAPTCRKSEKGKRGKCVTSGLGTKAVMCALSFNGKA